MKTIEEAAKQYAISLKVSNGEYLSKDQMELYATIDFKHGIAFAQRFIPVDEELPEIPESSKMVSVIAKLDEGNGFSHLICFFTKSGKFFNTTPRLLPQELCSTVNIGHEDVTDHVVSWLPIEFK